jgi:hypothetical protein
MTEDIPKAQEYMLTLTNKKIEQHITYLLGVIGIVFTFVNIPDKYLQVLIERKLHLLFYLLLGSFVIHNFGKLIYWSVMNNFILTHKPTKVASSQFIEDDEIYWPNAKWGFFDAAKKDILQKKPYNKLKRNWFEKIKLLIARFFSSLYPLIVCVVASLIIWKFII